MSVDEQKMMFNEWKSEVSKLAAEEYGDDLKEGFELDWRELEKLYELKEEPDEALFKFYFQFYQRKGDSTQATRPENQNDSVESPITVLCKEDGNIIDTFNYFCEKTSAKVIEAVRKGYQIEIINGPSPV